MKLKNMKNENCPVCGCSTIIRESVEVSNGEIRKHCNGEQWESRTFLCGQEIKYIPNFHNIELCKYNCCTNNEEYKERIRKLKKAKKDLIDYINILDVSEDQKNTWKYYI